MSNSPSGQSRTIFPSYAEGQAGPYGIYDLAHNLGYVAVGKSADTPEFAVDAIAWWWLKFGSCRFPDVPELLILADAGGSNGYRPRRWKQQLQVKIADAFGLAVTVCHYPTVLPNGTRLNTACSVRSAELGLVHL